MTSDIDNLNGLNSNDIFASVTTDSKEDNIQSKLFGEVVDSADKHNVGISSENNTKSWNLESQVIETPPSMFNMLLPEAHRAWNKFTPSGRLSSDFMSLIQHDKRFAQFDQIYRLICTRNIEKITAAVSEMNRETIGEFLYVSKGGLFYVLIAQLNRVKYERIKAGLVEFIKLLNKVCGERETCDQYIKIIQLCFYPAYFVVKGVMHDDIVELLEGGRYVVNKNK